MQKPVTQAPAMADARRRIVEGPIAPTLARLAAPNIAVVVLGTIVTLADIWLVSRLGLAPLAALALVFPIQAMMGMMSAGGMGGGVSSAIARALGAGDRLRAEALGVHALVIACLMAALYTLIFGVAARPLFALLGGKGEVLDGAVLYAHVLFGGAITTWLANTCASILRGTGNMSLPGYALMAGSVLHVPVAAVLTLGLGGAPSLGVAGPAAAALLTSAASAAVLGTALMRGSSGIKPRLNGTRLRAGLFLDILRVGLVACGNALLTIATIVIVTGLVGRYGTAALAGYGLGSRLELMLIPIAFGVGGAMTAMVGTNRGAGRFDRARRVAFIGGSFVLGVTGLVGIVAVISPDLWIGLFTTDEKAAGIAHTYLRIAGPFYGFFGVGMALYFATQGTGNMTWPFVSGLVRAALAGGGGALVALAMGAPLEALFAAVAAGLFLFGAILIASLWGRTWRGPKPQAGLRP